MGAVQIYELKSGGSWKRCGAASPEVLEASTEFGGAEGDDGVCARDGPVHAGALEAGADQDFTAGFHDAGRGTQTLCVELGIAHAAAVPNNVDNTFGRWIGGGNVRPERSDNSHGNRSFSKSCIHLVYAHPRSKA